MNVTYSDQAKQWPEGYALLQQATNRLEKIVGDSADQVKADWDGERNGKGRLLYTLRLSDATGTVLATFPADELKFAEATRIGLHHLWGGLLKIHSDLQHQKVQDLLAALEEERD